MLLLGCGGDNEMKRNFKRICDYPNCEKEATVFIAGTFPGDIEPSKWCIKHYKNVSERKKKKSLNRGDMNHQKAIDFIERLWSADFEEMVWYEFKELEKEKDEAIKYIRKLAGVK